MNKNKNKNKNENHERIEHPILLQQQLQRQHGAKLLRLLLFDFKQLAGLVMWCVVYKLL